MRTNIEIDDQLLAEAQKLSGIKTKRDLVDAALRLLVRVKHQEAALELPGKVRWEGNLDEMREG